MLTLLVVLLALALLAGVLVLGYRWRAGAEIWERRARIEAERHRAERQLQTLTMAAMGQLLHEARRARSGPRP